jgi:hypothetical protein
MNQIIHIEDGEEVSLAGVAASPSAQASAAGSSVIQFPFQAHCRRPRGLEDASDPVEGFESIGSLAVRIVGQFELPRLVVMTVQGGEEP